MISHLREGDEAQELARHAIVQRIAGGENDRPAAAQRRDALDHGGKGLRPFVDLGPVRRQEAEKPLGADNHFCSLQMACLAFADSPS